VNYLVSGSAPTLNIVVSVKDSAGKSDSKSVSVSVSGVAATISLVAPTNGSTVTKGVTEMKANVSGSITGGVRFTIISGSQSKTVDAEEKSGAWVATLPNGVVSGSAKISASAKSSNGTDIISNTVNVTIQ